MSKLKQKKKVSRQDFDVRKDIHDPGKVRQFVTEQFRRTTRHIAHVESSWDTREILDAFDLTELYRIRRIRAVSNYLPVILEKYGDRYPGPDLADDWTMFCSRPILPYDQMDFDYSLCLGAALWMLDTFKEHGLLAQALTLLRQTSDDADADLPPVYDPCYAQDILCEMVYVIQHRYRKDGQSYILPLLKRGGQTFDTNSGDTYALFRQLVALLPENTVRQAVERFRQETWAWADLYFEGAAEISARIEKNDRRFHSLARQVQQMQEEIDRTKPRPGKSLLMVQSSLDLQSLWNENTADQRRAEVLHLAQRMDQLEEEQKALEDEQFDLQVWGLQAAATRFETLAEHINPEMAEKLCHFRVADPFETCFALLYLLEQYDDLPWLYSFPVAVLCAAGNQLPWSRTTYDEEDDSFWPEPAPCSQSIRRLAPEWYEADYITDDAGWEKGASDRASLAQIIYQMTGTLLPRNMQRYAAAKKRLRREGLSPSKVNSVIAVMAVLGEASRQCSGELFDSPWDEEEEELQEIAQATEQTENNELSAVEENERLKHELDNLRRAAHAAETEAKQTKQKLAELAQNAERQRLELADLRELVFRQQNGTEEAATEDTSIRFPYRTRHRIVVFGGHDSWLREIRQKLPDVRFVYKDVPPNPNLIRHADVVWIQTNCLSHSTYSVIMDTVRRYSKLVRYFSYASAVKCAEQVVEQDQKGDALPATNR